MVKLGKISWKTHLLKPLSWTPIIKGKQKNSCWVQLSGHEGSLISNGKGSVLKRYSQCEAECLLQLQLDILRSFVPKYQGEKMLDGERYLKMQDLLCNFKSPSVMDCKIGQRTYSESEVIADSSENFRKDLYLKMISTSPNVPTEREHREKGVSKLRYLQWRDTISSTAEFGFRIEAIKLPSESTRRDFQHTRKWDEIINHCKLFIQSRKIIAQNYLLRLLKLRTILEVSDFFAKHEFIGSSLLFVHDESGYANIWLIDFAKVTSPSPLDHKIRVNHRSKWQCGNYEDGYLIGIDNLVKLFEEIIHECH
ncbi:Inositol-trisphosphate 3-kinase B isoform 1 [Schistosoma japonicum]|uniref:Kinase n=2 Tax=Schistosoma japonicum TaxID=6182 RepID=A0A4Z2DUA5_SCHJA|nr:Inositol-trisphosphate 3-kinase B isoform 1 [Schistosoma japonicum]